MIFGHPLKHLWLTFSNLFSLPRRGLARVSLMDHQWNSSERTGFFWTHLTRSELTKCKLLCIWTPERKGVGTIDFRFNILQDDCWINAACHKCFLGAGMGAKGAASFERLLNTETQDEASFVESAAWIIDRSLGSPPWRCAGCTGVTLPRLKWVTTSPSTWKSQVQRESQGQERRRQQRRGGDMWRPGNLGSLA